MSILFKFFFYIKKLKLVVVLSDGGNSGIADIILKASGSDIKVEKVNFLSKSYDFLKIFGNEMIIMEADVNKKEHLAEVSFLTRESCLPIFVLNDLNVKEIKKSGKLLKNNKEKGVLILGFKDNLEIKIEKTEVFQVGFQKKSDLHISDLNVDENTNFKISNRGDVVPFWFDGVLKEKEIVSVALAVGACMAAGLNLVQISQNLKDNE